MPQKDFVTVKKREKKLKKAKDKRKKADAPTCPYCLDRATLSYDEKRWECVPCKASVSIAKHTITFEKSVSCEPMGTLAKADDRWARKQLHSVFDPLWRNHPKVFSSRNDAYAWMADFLDISREECHIAMFYQDTCFKVINHIKAMRK